MKTMTLKEQYTNDIIGTSTYIHDCRSVEALVWLFDGMSKQEILNICDEYRDNCKGTTNKGRLLEKAIKKVLPNNEVMVAGSLVVIL